MHILIRREFMRRRLLVNIDLQCKHRVPLLCLYLCLAVFVCGAFDLLLARPASAKEHVDLVVTNGTVVTMDAQRHVIENGAVAVRGDWIGGWGRGGDLRRNMAAGNI